MGFAAVVDISLLVQVDMNERGVLVYRATTAGERALPNLRHDFALLSKRPSAGVVGPNMCWDNDPGALYLLQYIRYGIYSPVDVLSVSDTLHA